MTHEALSKSVGPSIVGFVTETPDANEMLQASKYQEGVMSLLLKVCVHLNVKLGTGLLLSNTKSTVESQLFLTQNKALTLFGNNQFLQLPYKFYNGLVDCETTTEGTMSSLTTVSTGESLDAFGDQNVTCVESQKRKLFHPPQSPSKGHTRRTQ